MQPDWSMHTMFASSDPSRFSAYVHTQERQNKCVSGHWTIRFCVYVSMCAHMRKTETYERCEGEATSAFHPISVGLALLLIELFGQSLIFALYFGLKLL